MHACVCVCVCVCVYVCACMTNFVIFVHTYVNVVDASGEIYSTYICAYMYKRMHKYMCTYVRIYTPNECIILYIHM